MTITDAEVEAAARAFDTFAFESWQQSYDYEMAQSGSADEAKGFADWCMGKRIEEVRTNARAALLAASQARALSSGEGWPDWCPPRGTHFAIDHDGFAGKVIGWYVRDDGAQGTVLQLDNAKVVHVYGIKWLTPAEANHG